MSIRTMAAGSGPAMDQRGRGTVFSEQLLTLALQCEDPPGARVGLSSVLDVVARWRDAIISNSNGLPHRVRSMLSGHSEEGRPLEAPHLAVLPLASVGDRRADGHLQGLGLVFPGDTAEGDRAVALKVIGAVSHLLLGSLGRWRVVPGAEATPSRVMRPEGWTAYPAGATQWSTMTPVVFDRHPKAKAGGAHQREAKAMIGRACARIGLPEPREVILTDVSAHFGVPPSFAFPKMRRKDGSERRHRHVILVFDEPVCGPVLIGAGRYRGYGACRPLVGAAW